MNPGLLFVAMWMLRKDYPHPFKAMPGQQRTCKRALIKLHFWLLTMSTGKTVTTEAISSQQFLGLGSQLLGK